MADTTHPVAEKKDSPSITVTLDPQFHAYVLKAAKEDERSPAKWLKRYVQEVLSKDRDLREHASREVGAAGAGLLTMAESQLKASHANR